MDYFDNHDNEVVQCLQENVERKNLWKLMNQQQPELAVRQKSSARKDARIDLCNIISYEELDISDQKIGHGGFGDIFAAQWNGVMVAVKKLRVQRVRAKRLNQFKEEVRFFLNSTILCLTTT